MDAGLALPLLVALIAVALAFDFLNGMNDAANSIATIVSTRVLRPQYAVAWAAFFNFIAFMVFGLHVAETVGRGIVEANVIDARVIFGALSGAIVWQIITNRLGIPSSSSHALIGGLVGAGMAKAGSAAVVWAGVSRLSPAIVLAPGLGCVTALFLMLVVSWTFLRFTPFGGRPIFPPCAIRLGVSLCAGSRRQRCPEDHGHHRRAALFAGLSGAQFHVPFWVVLACQAAMAAGHAGRRLADREDDGLKDHPAHPDAGLLRRNRRLDHAVRRHRTGIPVSTTHTITGCIIGVGAAKRVSAVRWGVAKEIVTRLDHHHPGGRADRGAVLFRGRAVRLNLRRRNGRPQKMKPRTGRAGLRVCLHVRFLRSGSSGPLHDVER